jgi:Holliday junction resolvase RusA-like endonuclease
MPRAHKDPEEATAEGKWILMAQQQVQGPPLEGPVIMIAQFLMPIPKSVPKRVMKFIQNGGIEIHEKKPDLDNLEKFAKDCLNGLAWKDDSQVGIVLKFKYYATEPRTVLIIEDAHTYNLGDFTPILERIGKMMKKEETCFQRKLLEA